MLRAAPRCAQAAYSIEAETLNAEAETSNVDAQTPNVKSEILNVEAQTPNVFLRSSALRPSLNALRFLNEKWILGGLKMRPLEAQTLNVRVRSRLRRFRYTSGLRRFRHQVWASTFQGSGLGFPSTGRRPRRLIRWWWCPPGLGFDVFSHQGGQFGFRIFKSRLQVFGIVFQCFDWFSQDHVLGFEVLGASGRFWD